MTNTRTQARPQSSRDVHPVPTPAARGPLSAWMLNRDSGSSAIVPPPIIDGGSGFTDDLQFALYLCYELHYSDVPGLASVDEWDPQVIAFRRGLESEFIESLAAEVGEPADPLDDDVHEAIPHIIESDDGPSLSTYMETSGTLDDVRRFVINRSAYQLKEADPHTFGIPRLQGRPKQLLATIQAGEYGADDSDHVMHADLFAQTMRSLGLDDRRHAYLDELPASALMVSNLTSLFGLNRTWRGALVGHLAVFEMTSVVPMGRYARALVRLGAPPQACRFFDVHVLADAAHEVQALEMATLLAVQEPTLASDILFGARCVNVVERLFATEVLAHSTAPGVRFPERAV